MRYIQAIVAIGLFGWLAFMVTFDRFPEGDGGSSKTRGLKVLVDNITQSIGPGLTGALLLMAGITIAWVIMRRGD